jgi:hypothetical protein
MRGKEGKKKKLNILFLLLSLLSLTSFVYAIRIRVTGQWSEIIDVNDLAGPPGSDLIPYQESAPNQSLVDITNTNRFWDVSIYKVDSLWPATFRLYVRRTGNGTGPGSISGGLNYLEITDAEQIFFSGSRQRRDIPLQFRLEGLSVQIPPQVYTTTIIYTVTER